MKQRRREKHQSINQSIVDFLFFFFLAGLGVPVVSPRPSSAVVSTVVCLFLSFLPADPSAIDINQV